MTHFYYRTIVLAMAFLAALFISLQALAYSDKVLVIVDEDVITQSELDARLRVILSEPDIQKQPGFQEALPGQVLESLINDRLQLQEAERRGLVVTDEEVEAAINRMAQQQSMSLAQFKQTLLQNGETFASVKYNIKDLLTISKLKEYYTYARVEVPDYEVDGFIEQNKLAVNDTEYQLAHILIKDPEQNLEIANDIVMNVRSGETSFQRAALNYSEAVDAQDGGVIGWRRLDQLPEIFANTIKKMSVGDISDVLTSANGLHILKLMDVKGTITEIEQHNVIHILFSATTDVAKSQAKKRALKVRQEIIEGADFNDMARVHSDDSVSAANGGELGWVNPGQMVPPFEAAYKVLNLGDVSQPVESRFGIHLIKVLDIRKQNITEQVLRSRAANLLRQQRGQREYQQWVRELREQAYVHYVDQPGSL